MALARGAQNAFRAGQTGKFTTCAGERGEGRDCRLWHSVWLRFLLSTRTSTKLRGLRCRVFWVVEINCSMNALRRTPCTRRTDQAQSASGLDEFTRSILELLFFLYLVITRFPDTQITCSYFLVVITSTFKHLVIICCHDELKDTYNSVLRLQPLLEQRTLKRVLRYLQPLHLFSQALQDKESLGRKTCFKKFP